MKKIIGLLLLILIDSSCSSELKSIDRKVSKIEKTITKNLTFGQNLCFDCNPDIDASTYFTKIENQIEKINFEIVSNNNCKEYSKKCTIYLENNVPILITLITKGNCEFENSGENVKTKKFQSVKQAYIISSNVKIYVQDWGKFEITVIGGSKFNYNLKDKERFQKIINKVMMQEKLK